MPKSFDQSTALDIMNRAARILAAQLPQCTLRQFDLSKPPGGRWPVLLCFADTGPIAPVLGLCDSRYHATTDLELDYWLLFWNARDLGSVIVDSQIPAACVRLDRGPETIAETMLQAIAKVDLAGLVAPTAIERILAEQPRYPVPWPNLQLATCAAYLGRDDEARSLLQDTLRYAKITKAQRYLTILDSSPDSLRQEFQQTIEYNWSHFKVVDQ
jgi:hypothetical protein